MKPATFLAVACTLLLLPPLSSSPEAQPPYTAWSEPVNLGGTINTTWTEHSPMLSKSRLSLYFSSDRPCGEGDSSADFNIWVAHRVGVDAPWLDPTCLEINSDGYEDSAPAFSRDGHWMFFVSNRPGGLGVPGTQNGRDLWLAWRAQVHDDHGWQQPVNASINTTLADTGPAYFANDDDGLPLLFFATNRDVTFDIWQATFVDGELGLPVKVAEVSRPDRLEARPTVSHDGLEMYFFAGALGVGVFDIYRAARPDVTAPWSEPERLGTPVNTEYNEQMPALSSDRLELLLASNRPGTFGGLDIWVSTRHKPRPE